MDPDEAGTGCCTGHIGPSRLAPDAEQTSRAFSGNENRWRPRSVVPVEGELTVRMPITRSKNFSDFDVENQAGDKFLDVELDDLRFPWAPLFGLSVVRRQFDGVDARARADSDDVSKG